MIVTTGKGHGQTWGGILTVVELDDDDFVDEIPLLTVPDGCKLRPM